MCIRGYSLLILHIHVNKCRLCDSIRKSVIIALTLESVTSTHKGACPLKDIRIGLIGTGGMGKAHATAFTNVPLVFGNQPGRPVLEIVADIEPKALERWAGEFGFARA